MNLGYLSQFAWDNLVCACSPNVIITNVPFALNSNLARAINYAVTLTMMIKRVNTNYFMNIKGEKIEHKIM